MAIQQWAIGFFRRFRSFVLGRDVEIVGQCNLCGNCCHDILLRDGAWIKKQRQFDKLCKQQPKHERFEHIGKDHHGHWLFRCTLQQKDGMCSCYEDRLPLCKGYPSKSLYYKGGRIGTDCGFRFKAVTFRDVLMRRKRLRTPNFSEVLDQETKRTDS